MPIPILVEQDLELEMYLSVKKKRIEKKIFGVGYEKRIFIFHVS